MYTPKFTISNKTLKNIELRVFSLEGKPLKPKLLANQKSQNGIVEFDSKVISNSIDVVFEIRTNQVTSALQGMALYVAVDPEAVGTVN